MSLIGSDESRIGSLIALPDVLAQLQASPQQVFRQAGLSVRLFDNPENRISHRDICRLLSVCESSTGRSDFGLLVGARFTLENFGTLGELMRNSATVGEALQMLIMYLHYDDRAAIPVIIRSGMPSVMLGYLLYHSAISGSGLLLDAAITVAYRILRELCGPAWQPVGVQFSHRRPRNTKPYRRALGRAVYFDAEFSGIFFEASWLDYPVVGADPARRSQLHNALRHAQTGAAISFAEEVQCALYGLLAGDLMSAASVAKLFSCSERTLRARLQQEGTTLQRLLAEARFERAHHLLCNTQMPVSRIAAALCYADSAVFSRAFHHWTGMSPRQWRARQTSPDDSAGSSTGQPGLDFTQ